MATTFSALIAFSLVLTGSFALPDAAAHCRDGDRPHTHPCCPVVGGFEFSFDAVALVQDVEKCAPDLERISFILHKVLEQKLPGLP